MKEFFAKIGAGVAGGFTKVTRSVAAWSMQQKVLTAVLGVLFLGGAGTIGVVVYQGTHSKPVAIVETEQKEIKEEPQTEVISTEKEKIVVTLPEYKDVVVYADSMEKDLNVYFTEPEAGRISGVPFSVKLLDQTQYEGLSPYVEELKIIGQAQTDLEAGNEVDVTEILAQIRKEDAQGEDSQISEDTEEASDDSKEPVMICGIPEEDFNQLTPQEQLGLQREESLKAYKEALEAIDAMALVDEDADGKIYQDGLDAGDYIMCYVPTDYYEADAYSKNVNVKDKIAYVPVENIEQKVEQYDASQDVQPAAPPEPEVKLQDTVSWVESNEEMVPGVYKEGSAVLPVASATDEVTKELPLESVAPQLLTESDTEGEISLATEKGGSVPPATPSGIAKLTAPTKISLYAKVANVITVQCNTEEVTGIACTPGENVTLKDNGNGSFTITAADVKSDVTTLVTFVASTAAGNIEIPATVTIAGTDTPVVDANGNKLFFDEKGESPLTYENYESENKVFVQEAAPTKKYYGWQTLDGTRYFFDANGEKVTGKQIINGQQYSFGSDGALLTSGRGIDVSKWQGKIDWSQVKNEASFAIIRCGFRGQSSREIYEDPYVDQNMKNATANGIRIGLYFYSTAQNEAQAVEEASLAVAIANRNGGVSLPIYFDIEDSATQGGLTTAERDAMVMAFCNTVRAAGYQAGVYANTWWFKNYLTPSSYPGWVSIWIARWAETPEYNGRFDIWQYSSKGSVSGISGNVDMNISYF